MHMESERDARRDQPNMRERQRVRCSGEELPFDFQVVPNPVQCDRSVLLECILRFYFRKQYIRLLPHVAWGVVAGLAEFVRHVPTREFNCLKGCRGVGRGKKGGCLYFFIFKPNLTQAFDRGKGNTNVFFVD
jgi:hypothetical protein